MEGEKSASKQESNITKLSLQTELKIMELVTQIAVARERNSADMRVIGDVNALVRTLFSTMCELVSEDKPLNVYSADL